MTTDESTDVVSTKIRTLNNATTPGLTMAVASTKRSTNAAMSQLPTTNVSAKNPTDNVKNKGPNGTKALANKG